MSKTTIAKVVSLVVIASCLWWYTHPIPVDRYIGSKNPCCPGTAQAEVEEAFSHALPPGTSFSETKKWLDVRHIENGLAPDEHILLAMVRDIRNYDPIIRTDIQFRLTFDEHDRLIKKTERRVLTGP